MIDSRYNRTIADKLNEWTGQPVFWAAIASLGLHGILFAALPSFSSGTVNLDERTVSVVELGAEDLQRLPDFPELDTPDLPDVDDPYDFGLDPLENWDDVLKDLGIEDDPEPRVPNSPGLLTPPRSPLLPPPTSTPRPLPGPIVSWPFSNPPRISITPSPTPVPAPTPTPTPTPPPPSSQGLQAANPDEIGDEEGQPANTGNTPSGTDDGTPVTPDLTPQQRDELIISRLNNDLQNRSNAIASYLENVRQSSESLGKWITEGGKAIGEIPIGDIAPFPLDACAVGQDAQALLGVFVGRNNKVKPIDDVPNPVFIHLAANEFIAGTLKGQYFDAESYTLLDKAALEFVESYAYDTQEEAGQQRRYFFTVQFQYDEEECNAYLAEKAAANAIQQAESANQQTQGTNEPSATPSSGNAESGTPSNTASSETNDQADANAQDPVPDAQSDNRPAPQPSSVNGQSPSPSDTLPAVDPDAQPTDVSPDVQPSSTDGPSADTANDAGNADQSQDN